MYTMRSIAAKGTRNYNNTGEQLANYENFVSVDKVNYKIYVI